ncbi:MAG TPA: serine/threonine-protein kinase [Steroidobacteraceae bacterium]|jgi:serine/threonine-protein kinase
MSDETWHALSKYLDEALDLPDPERSIWLRRLRDADPAFAAKLAHLLEARAQPGYSEFLEAPVASLAGAAGGAILVGRRIGAYVIEAEIGRGGMGSVWRARRDDGRYEGFVAVKFVHAARIGQAGDERFRVEGKLLGKLDHPNIGRLLDAGMLDGNQPYLVLEYFEGEQIDAYCDRHELSVEARVKLFLDVLAAVGHAHSHLIVHRDLKPPNILITREGSVKLLDFGIAKLLDADDTSLALTQSRAVPLTPQYAAPEQLLGHPVTTATDIYALGLVLYVCLTGTHPVPARTRSNADLLRSVLTDEPPRPSEVAVGAGIEPRALEGDLDNIIGKALKKNPSERYASAGAFADDLTRFLRHEPVSARADTWPYRIVKFARRNRGAVIAGVLVAIALIGVGIFAVINLFEARAQRDLAKLEAAHARAQSDLTEFLLGDSLSLAPRELVAQRLDRARTLIDRRFADEPEIQARLLLGLSGRYIDVGESKAGSDVMNEAQAISRRVNDPWLNADIACGKAQDAVEVGNLRLAHEQETIGLDNLRRLSPVSPELFAECAMATAYIAEREGNYGRATAAMSDAMKNLQQAHLERTSRYTSIAHEYARSLSLAGDYRQAWAAEQSVMAVVKEVGREDSDAYYAMVNVAGTALIAGGEPKKALELLDATIEKARNSTPNAELPFYLEATRLIARSAQGIRGSEERGLMHAADQAEKQGLATAVATYRVDAIRAALDGGDIAAADADWVKISPLESKYLADPAWQRDAKRLLMAHARLNLAKHDLAAAANEIAMAAGLDSQSQQASDPEWEHILVMRGEIELAQQAYDAADADAQAAVTRARQEAVDPNSSAWIGEALILRGRCESAMGNKTAAAASAREALPHLQQNLDPSDPLLAQEKTLEVTGT